MIRHRLKELGLDQRDLAAAVQVTESYISQLLAGKKAPPAPRRTDMYPRMEVLLKLPSGHLSALAESERAEALRQSLGERPAPLLKETRALILRKCPADKEKQVRAIFERQPLGELERLVAQKLLEVVKNVAQEELGNEAWVQTVARLSGQSYEQTRATTLEFLDSDVFDLSAENIASFLEPLLESWEINLETFALEIVLNRRVTADPVKKLELVEKDAETETAEPGFQAFLTDPHLSGDATKEEMEFLRKLRLRGKRPTPLYYYRELQNLRDPLHFAPS